MKRITTNLAPNYQDDDIRLSWKTLFSPWKWRSGEAALALENTFEKYLNVSKTLTFSSGRAALYAILQSLDLPEGSEVLLQAYTCVAVPDPVLWAGLKPVYIDCDQSLCIDSADLEAKITNKSKVLIIQHTFGQVANLEKIIAVAKKHDLFVIEDCAHALGAEYQGQKVGTFGDVSFFSFGRDKVISSVFGGIVATNDPELALKIGKIREKFDYPSLIWIKKQLLHPIIAGNDKKYDNFITNLIFKVSKKINLISKSVYKQEKVGGKPYFYNKKMANALAILALHQFHKLEQYNNHRKEIADQYYAMLADIPGVTLPKAKGGQKPIYLRYTILSERAPEITTFARKKNIFLGDWYDCPIAPFDVEHKKIGFDEKTCPNASKFAKMTVNLPTDITVSKSEAKKIAEVVKEVIDGNS